MESYRRQKILLDLPASQVKAAIEAVLASKPSGYTYHWLAYDQDRQCFRATIRPRFYPLIKSTPLKITFQSGAGRTLVEVDTSSFNVNIHELIDGASGGKDAYVTDFIRFLVSILKAPPLSTPESAAIQDLGD